MSVADFLKEVERQYRLLDVYHPALGCRQHEAFQAARQTLAWVMNPDLITSPAAMLIGERVNHMNYDGLTSPKVSETAPGSHSGTVA